VVSLRKGAAVILMAGVFATGCSRQQSASNAADPSAVLRTIPPADPSQYDRIENMRQWRNPYVIIRADDVALLDAADSAEIILKPEEVLPALARLAPSNWPYGRVVAAAEPDVGADEKAGIAMRRNKGIVGGMLESAHVAVKWVPLRDK
jgi:hypothetical protein